MNYYVYYKVSPAQLEQVRPRVQDLFRRAKLDFGVTGRWMRRRDDPTTYMEVFEDVKDEATFEALLAREGARFGVQRKFPIMTVSIAEVSLTLAKTYAGLAELAAVGKRAEKAIPGSTYVRDGETMPMTLAS